MGYIGKPQSADPIEVNTSNITDGTITNADISGSFATSISGSFTDASSSFSTRVTATEASGALLDGDGTVTFGSVAINTTSTDAKFVFTATEDSSTAAPVIDLKRNSSSPADADYLGQIKFKGENDADQEVVYAKVTGKIQDASDGSEDGIIEFANKKAGSNVITARLRSDSLQLLNSTNLSVAGTTSLTGTLDVTGVSTFSDDVTVQGTLTAQEIHTEFTSASIMFESGSTKFGDTSDDVHSMTGSLNVSGAINLNDGDAVFGATATVETGLNLESGTFTVKNATGDSNGLKISQGGSDASNILNHYNGTLNLGVANSVDMTLKGGLVGIGTNNPTSLLHLKETDGDANAGPILTLQRDNSASEDNGDILGEIQFQGSDSINTTTTEYSTIHSKISNVSHTVEEGTLVFKNMVAGSSTEVMNIVGNKVGIGTGSPNSILDINSGASAESSADAGAITVTSQNSGVVTALRLRHEDASGGGTDADEGIAIKFQGYDGSNFRNMAQISVLANDAVGSSDSDGNIIFSTTTSGGTALSEKMRITESGRVGIGTNSPDRLLHVEGNGGGHAVAVFEDTAANANILIKATVADKNSILNFGDAGSTEIGQIDYDHADNSMRFVTNAGERMRILSDGRVAIKATSLPQDFGSARGHLLISSEDNAGANNYGVLLLQGYSISNDVATGGIYFYDHSNNNATIQVQRDTSTSTGNLMFYTNSGSGVSERMRIMSTGAVGIGTNNPATLGLHVKAEDGGQATFIENSWNGSPDASSVLDVKSTNTNKANNLIRGYNGGSNVFAVEIDGDVQNTNGTYGSSLSDRRVKENITNATNKLDSLNALSVKNFNFIGSDKKQIGFIADEFEQVFPSLVKVRDTREYDDDGNVISGYEDAKGLKVGMEFAILVKAIQELSDENDSLKSRIEALES